MAGYSSVFIDSGENYQKQSWRNRCRILTADGPQDWMVPVVHSSGRAITQIEVEYTTPWVVKFERAVASAYDSSPFFEFYRDEFFAILDSHPATLWELKSRITEWICRKIGIAFSAGEVPPPSGVRPSGSPHHPCGAVPPLPCRGWHVPQGEDLPGSFDLLTANPPYVMVAEKADMRQNVLGWEPHMAIFAPEEDPLVFHKAIAEVAMRVLVSGGCGIVEINSEIPDQTAAVFIAAGFEDIRIIPDYFDRPRFISFRRP